MATLEQLAKEWLDAKSAEDTAKKARITIEELIVEQTGKRDEGSKTHTFGTFKVVVTGKVTRKMDWAKWETIKAQIPAALQPVKYKPEVDDRGCAYLQQNEPEIYQLLPLTVTPAKTAIEVKEVKE